MMRSVLRRWAVPGVAIGSMVVPALVGLGFPQLGGYGGFGFSIFDECSECVQCYESAPETEKEIIDAISDDPPDPPTNDPPTDDPPNDEGATDALEGEARRQQGGRIPDAVTRPRIDPQLNHSPGYKVPPPKASKY